jgi:hypothetical protein
MVRRVGLLTVLALLALACSSGSKAAAPTSAPPPASASESVAPTSFAPAVCSDIFKWQNRMVNAANAFSDDSPNLDVPGRRARYSRAFDDQKVITNDLRADLVAAPGNGVADAEAIRAVLLSATHDVQTTLRLNQADAASHPDSDFEFQAVKEDRLFGGTEKTLSQVLKPLDEQSRLHNVPDLGGTCGRA